MLKEKRYDEIKEYIIDNEQVSMKELQEKFNVSMNTIRRDTSIILKDQRFEKIYGGIKVKENPIVPFASRNVKNIEIKMNIAKVAANEIEKNDIIYIDSGTTTRYLLNFLNPNINITIITNNLDIIIQSENFPNISVFILGNFLKKDTRSFIGIPSKDILDRYNVTKAFMSATAVSIKGGLMNSDALEYEIKKYIVDKNPEIYLLVDDSKFNKSTLFTYAELNKTKTVISNFKYTEDYIEYSKNNDIQLKTV